ncbi:MAG: hypothetical protein LBQ79_09470 [Deltaproteobacteria bacterium]|jgi:hypothetical protein|nr:hypothetical protein [Deltaproteobacteria bacterium]
MRNTLSLKLFSMLGLAALVLAAAPLAAQAPSPVVPMPPNPFQGQAELTASDIPIAVEILEAAKNAGTDQSAMMAVFSKNNIDPTRGAYILARTTSGINILASNLTLEQATAQAGGPALIPTEAEFALIKENEAALKAALGMPPQ